MKRHNFFIGVASAAIVVLSLLSECSRNIAGATTETTNGVAGVIHSSENMPAPGAVVRLYPDDFDPVRDAGAGDSFIDTTNAAGEYRFGRVPAGRYVVLARNRGAATSFLAREIVVTNDTFTTAPMGILDKSGAIEADFSPNGVVTGEGYVYIPGTDISSTIGSNGSVLLADVPTGRVAKVLFATQADEKRNILRDEIAIAAGDTVAVERPLWSFSHRIILNTTASGADVMGNVINLPILLRLNRDNFNFTEAKADGSDLNFGRSGTKALMHEIERWDVTGQSAEVWVKVDTVFGNDSTQSIMMYWGNSGVSSLSAGGGVFDTADGYQGVWHLGESAEGAANDATVNGYDGDSPENARPVVAAGAIGNGRSFDGAADFITMPNTAEGKLNFPESGTYTVYAWVLLDSLDNKSHCIVSKGYEQYYLRSTYISKSMTSATPLWEFVEFGETVKWQTSTSPAASRQWSLVVGVRQGAKQVLYCNGVVVDSSTDIWTNDVSRNAANDLTFGRFAKQIVVPINEGYCYFKGSIDEVRIIGAAQSADWVRLCYMNQRSDDRLTVFR